MFSLFGDIDDPMVYPDWHHLQEWRKKRGIPPAKKDIEPLPLLYAPEEYWLLTDSERACISNGCGAKGICGWIVPDRIWGLSITEACNIHDFMYFMGETKEDKEHADRVFLNNMLRLIEVNTKWDWLKKLRAKRARTYYRFVCEYGGPAFWAGKNAPEKLGMVKHA